MKQCPNCAAEVQDGWNACPICTINLKEAERVLGHSSYITPDLPEVLPEKVGSAAERLLVDRYPGTPSPYDEFTRRLQLIPPPPEMSTRDSQDTDPGHQPINPDMDNSTETVSITKGQMYLIGIAGGLLLIIGCFSPILSSPLGPVTIIFAGNTCGMVLLFLAIVSLVLAILGRDRELLATGLASLGLIGYRLVEIWYGLSKLQTQIDQFKTEGVFANAFAQLVGQTMIKSIQISWGWIPLVLGALLVVLPGALWYRR